MPTKYPSNNLSREAKELNLYILSTAHAQNSNTQEQNNTKKKQQTINK